MIRFRNGIALLVYLFAAACSTPVGKTEDSSEQVIEMPSKAEQIIEASIAAHGGELYDKAHYRFTFRENLYRFKNEGNAFEYEFKGLNKSGDSIHTLLTESAVQVSINGEVQNLNEKQKLSYSDNLNSVIYFATLPYKLGDKSVNKTYQGTVKINGLNYEVIKVTFDQEGGGTDFDDQYYYWINSETNLIDYLAYNYHTNGGGVRFRSAYNSKKVGGIVFQDYINYKAEVGTPLEKLPSLFEMKKLQELSLIETENIIVVKK